MHRWGAVLGMQGSSGAVQGSGAALAAAEGFPERGQGQEEPPREEPSTGGTVSFGCSLGGSQDRSWTLHAGTAAAACTQRRGGKGEMSLQSP